eukprot:CAMPEP_0196657282 /NCGR_PEP_ID=MMETSP1086-20130531/22553_1 /TAXON_ID=77921 /ORGANISM="Cyanoptyche  gloeocystis , Strain SAG4.97" /LENGTH=99 /DNA_ID=CAMNT_0041990345 /DNA_START=213 /DNA_END=509 /DNA_ORIENTATION=-
MGTEYSLDYLRPAFFLVFDAQGSFYIPLRSFSNSGLFPGTQMKDEIPVPHLLAVEDAVQHFLNTPTVGLHEAQNFVFVGEASDFGDEVEHRLELGINGA